MAHAVQEAPAAKQATRATKARRARRAPIEDVVTFPVPRSRLIASFPVDLDPAKMRRRTPHIVFEPELEEE